MANPIIRWRKPVPLKLVRGYATYEVDFDKFESEPGIYVFCRPWGDTLVPLYIGQAKRVRGRLVQQFNNLKLMRGVYDSTTQKHKRCLMHGYIKGVPGLTQARALNIAERVCIEHAEAAGYELVNIQGIGRKHDTLTSMGSREGTGVFEKTMYSVARKPRKKG